MIELSTIFIKDAGGNFQFLGKIKCEQCGHYYSIPDFHKAVFFYGVYLLVSPTDGYIGTKCINQECPKTLTLSGTREEIDHIKGSLFSMLDLGNFQPHQPDFRYHSPVKYSPEQYSHPKPFNILYSTWDISGINAETVDMHVRTHEQDESYLADGYYNSFVEGRGKPIGNILSVWWFNKEQVENIIKIEDEKQIRIFPRYMLYDPLYSEVESFCWDYYFAQKFYGSPTLPTSAEIKTGNKDKNIITKNYDFSLLLETAPYATVGPTQMVVSLVGHSFSYLKKNIDWLNNESDLMQNRLIEHEKMVGELWGNYQSQHIQDQLSRLSTDFIFEYIKAAQRTDFSYSSLWELKSNYLKNLSNSSRSRRRRALNEKRSREKHQELIAQECPAFQHIISHDDKINEIKLDLTTLAGSPRKNKIFLLLGDSGTGKTLFAEGIHKASGKREKPFVRVNSGAIPESLFESEMFGHEKGTFTGAVRDRQGKFQAADGGTLFLDEIGDLTKENQKKLLLVLDGDDRTFTPLGATTPVAVEVTTILATNKDLLVEVEKENFRDDLRMRIKPLSYSIPPLRERGKADLELLAKYLTKKEAVLCKKQQVESVGIAAEALDMLAKYTWPGNVRELEGVITKIIMLRDEKDTSDISEHEITSNLSEFLTASKKDTLKSVGLKPTLGKRKLPAKEIIVDLLNRYKGNKSKVARHIGVSREHLSRELTKIGL